MGYNLNKIETKMRIGGKRRQRQRERKREWKKKCRRIKYTFKHHESFSRTTILREP